MTYPTPSRLAMEVDDSMNKIQLRAFSLHELYEFLSGKTSDLILVYRRFVSFQFFTTNSSRRKFTLLGQPKLDGDNTLNLSSSRTVAARVNPRQKRFRQLPTRV